MASAQPTRALQAADIALKHAVDHEIAYLISKARLYRGLALLSLGRWKEAECDFGHAGGVRGWGIRVGRLREGCLTAMREKKSSHEDITSETCAAEVSVRMEAQDDNDLNGTVAKRRTVLW